MKTVNYSTAACLSLALALAMDRGALATEFSTNDYLTIEQDIQHSSSKNLDKLEQKVAKILQEKPFSLQGHYLLSSVYLRMFLENPADLSYLKQSAELARQAFEINSQSDLGVCALANVLETSGEYEKGLALLDAAQKKGIQNTWRFYLVKGTLLSSVERTDEALSSFELAFQAPESNRNEVVSQITKLTSSVRETEKVVNFLATLNQKYPSEELASTLLQFSLRFNSPVLAKKYYDQLSTLNAHSPQALVSKSLYLAKVNAQFKDAIKLLDLALSQDIPENLKSTLKLNKALYSIKIKSDAIDISLLKNAMTSSIDPESTTLTLVESMLQENKVEGAIRFLSYIENEMPGIALSYALRGEILSSKLRRHKDAIAAFTDAIALNDTRSVFFNGRGLALYNLKNFSSALKDFESAIKIDPSDASARYNAACAFAVLGKKKEALASLANAINLDSKLLIQARSDKDFKDIRDTQEFADITSIEMDGLAH